jgi:flap endonuclease-1
VGVSISELVEGKVIDLAELKDKVIAIDTFNFLYQFLATIRGPDGSLLTNAQGEVTSHLVGLFSRSTRLMQAGLKLVFIIDGEPPKLKQQERERRKRLKADAEKEYEIAKERKDFEAMKKFASRTSKLTKEMITDAIGIMTLLGLPHVQAPSEGEAQAAYMADKGDVDAIASQDFDSLLFGAPIIIRNLSITGKRKRTGKVHWVTVQPERVTLSDVLNTLSLDREQLIVLGMLVGTDFNNGGIKGIGPKKALKLLQEHGTDFGALFTDAGWDEHFDFPWKDVFSLFKEMPTTDDYTLRWKAPDTDGLRHTLVDKHGFEESRISGSLERLEKAKEEQTQKGLGDFF